MNFVDTMLFIVLPYVALVVFIIGSIYRYNITGFKFSSLSSQFLEGRHLFWGSVPFHIGIMVVFFGHLFAFLLPDQVLNWNSNSLRLIVLEVTGFIFGLAVLVGIINLMLRRLTHPRLKPVTNFMDIFIELLILVQVVSGLWIAGMYRWGSSWFAAVLTPYLRSIFIFQPDIMAVSAMPWVVKLHIALAFGIVLLIPFSRLVHFLVPPLHYLFRPYQIVMWNWNRKKIRFPRSPWTVKQPKNN